VPLLYKKACLTGVVPLPAFAGVSLAALARSGTLVACTSCLGLYLVNTLGYSCSTRPAFPRHSQRASFAAAPAAARLADRAPPRFTVGGSLALAATGMWMSARLDGDSRWTVLLAGFIVGGLVRASTTSSATSPLAWRSGRRSRARPGRRAAGEVRVSMTTQVRGSSNATGEAGTRLAGRLAEMTAGLPPRADSCRAGARGCLATRAGRR
jgi:hypothetical protein